MTETTVTKTCDLCGKVVQEFYRDSWSRDKSGIDRYPAIQLQLLYHQKSHESIDLCKECNDALLCWIEQRKTK